jgi:hypothetical protein
MWHVDVSVDAQKQLGVGQRDVKQRSFGRLFLHKRPRATNSEEAVARFALPDRNGEEEKAIGTKGSEASAPRSEVKKRSNPARRGAADGAESRGRAIGA